MMSCDGLCIDEFQIELKYFERESELFQKRMEDCVTKESLLSNFNGPSSLLLGFFA